MANLIQYAAIFQQELDKAAVEGATSGWMEINSALVKYEGGATVKIPRLDMDGLADYDRKGGGFVEGNVDFGYDDMTMTQDRGRLFTFDEHDVDETGFLLTAPRVMGEFQRTKVVPEIDAYRYSTIATGAMAKDKASYAYTPAEGTLLSKLYYDIAAVQEIVGADTPLIITMPTAIAAMFDLNDKLSRTVNPTEFAQGDIKLQVKALNGMHPIIRVGSARMKTAYNWFDGKTAGQEKGGFKPKEDALDINWIICPKTAALAVSKTAKMRIFDPETYQKSRSWAVDYRKYHDCWVTENKWPSFLVNIKQAKPSGG
jgi:hypothetical protein